MGKEANSRAVCGFLVLILIESIDKNREGIGRA